MRRPIVRVDYGSGGQLEEFPAVLWDKVKKELDAEKFKPDSSANPHTVAALKLLADAPKYFPGIKRCEVIDPELYPNQIEVIASRSY
jgi:hypothetical protein